MTVGSTPDRDREDGGYFAVPIDPRDLDAVRAWCCENCLGDFIPVLGRRVLFERHDDAALAALWWRAEED